MKFYIISIFQGTTTFFTPQFYGYRDVQEGSATFGMLVFSSLIDNDHSPRRLLIIC